MSKSPQATASKLDLAAIKLPSLKAATLGVVRLVTDPEVDVRELASAIEKDAGLTATVLKLANSAFFRRPSKVSNIGRALVVVGLDAMRSVVLGLSVMQAVQDEIPGFDFRAHWRDSLLRGCIARTLAEKVCRGLSSEAYLVGLLQDLGVPILAQHNPAYLRVLDASKGCKLQLDALESEAEFITHSEVVGMLCRQWLLPELLRLPLTNHHVRPPTRSSNDTVEQLTQIAYIVGSLPVGSNEVERLKDRQLQEFIEGCFGLTPEEFEQVLTTSIEAFEALREPFEAQLPADCDAAAAIGVVRQLLAQAPDADLSALDVLLVDPSRMMKMIVTKMLKAMGVDSIRHVATGQEALEACQVRAPSLVVTSLHLKDMQATELEVEVRRAGLDDTRFLLLSSSRELSNLAFSDTAKIATLAKPFQADEFHNELSKLCAGAQDLG